jgi:septum formation protein
MADQKTSIPNEPPPSYESSNQRLLSPSTPSALPPRGPLPLELPALVRLRNQRVILASASPRRRALLSQIGLRDIEIIPSPFAEDLPKTLSPMDYVLQTAIEKVRAVYNVEVNNAEKGEPALVIAADTIVVSHFGQILEKPRSMKEHVEMIKMLRDQGVHKVYTGVAVMRPLESAVEPGYVLESHIEDTTVHFDKNGECANAAGVC